MNAKILPSKSAGSNSSVLQRSFVVSSVATSSSTPMRSSSSSVASFDLIDPIGIGDTLLTNARDAQWIACSIQHAHRSFGTHCLWVGSTRSARMAIALLHTVEPSAVPQPSVSGFTNPYLPRISIRSAPVFSPEWSPMISRKARTCSCRFQLASIQ